MSDKRLNFLRVLSLIITAGMLLWGFLSWPSRHSVAWNCGFLAILLANSLIQYRWGRNPPAPNLFISLFPKTIQQSPESPKH